MTRAERIEYFDGRGVRQIYDAFVVSKEEMEVVLQMAKYVSGEDNRNGRLIEFAQNWERELEVNGIRNIAFAQRRVNDGRLCPQYNTERREIVPR